MNNSAGLVLNVSAGGTTDPMPNVVELEYAIFRNTDVAANVHSIPFIDNTFEAVVCLNAFEHYESPPHASAELFRVLKPGGRIFIHTAFLQPLHEAPHHFFNCTEFGLRKWFEQFEEVDLRVSPNFNPLYALAWIASDLEGGLRITSPKAAELIGSKTLLELAQFWRRREDPGLAAAFAQIPDDIQRRLAAGFEYIGRKPA